MPRLSRMKYIYPVYVVSRSWYLFACKKLYNSFFIVETELGHNYEICLEFWEEGVTWEDWWYKPPERSYRKFSRSIRQTRNYSSEFPKICIHAANFYCVSILIPIAAFDSYEAFVKSRMKPVTLKVTPTGKDRIAASSHLHPGASFLEDEAAKN